MYLCKLYLSAGWERERSLRKTEKYSDSVHFLPAHDDLLTASLAVNIKHKFSDQKLDRIISEQNSLNQLSNIIEFTG